MDKISLNNLNQEQELKQQEILEQFEKESTTRKFDSYALVIGIYWISIAIALYHFITAAVGYPATHLHRSLHVAMMLFMTFFLYPIGKKSSRKTIPWYDIALALASIAVAVYVWVDYVGFINRMGSPNLIDVIFGTMLIILVLEDPLNPSGRW